MTIRSSVALILIASVVGALIGRAVPRDAPNAQAAPSTLSALSVAMRAGHSCEAKRAELASTKAKLAICMAFDTLVSEAEVSGIPELSEPADPQSMSRVEEIPRNRNLLKTYSEAVIVQHHDGSTGFYKPDEWPIDGDGVIVARKLPSGDIGWYSGPDAGPRSDPAAFSVQTVASASPAPSDAAPAVYDCKAERSELASTKVQLAICMAISMRAPETAPSDVPDASTHNPQKFESPESRRNRELLENDSEAVIVRRPDGTIGIYKSDEWPIDGDELIIGRKFPNRQIGWYSRPVAGPRSNPAAFGQPNPPMFRGTSIELEPDGTITVRGKPAPPWVTRMLGGKVDEPDGN